MGCDDEETAETVEIVDDTIAAGDLPSSECDRSAPDQMVTPPMTAEAPEVFAPSDIMMWDALSTPATASRCHSPLSGPRPAVTTQVRLIQDGPWIRGEISEVECLLSKKDLAPFGGREIANA